MESEVKDNKKYVGQVADVIGNKKRVSFVDRLLKVTEQEGTPYLMTFSKKSIYLVSILTFGGEENTSCVANLPLKDMPLITQKTKLAETEIFRIENHLITETAVPSSEPPQKNEPENKIPLAFTKLKVGSFSGKSPGDLLLDTDDAEKIKADLQRQMNFLKSKLSVYPKNQEQINAIEDALNLFELGILKDSRPQNNETEKSESSDDASRILIYKTPVKHQKKKDKTGKLNSCYSMLITCAPGRTYPYRLEIMNCWAPLGKLSNGITPVLINQAKDMVKESIDISEADWLNVIDSLNENTNQARQLWYPECRKNDEANRWKPMQSR